MRHPLLLLAAAALTAAAGCGSSPAKAGLPGPAVASGTSSPRASSSAGGPTGPTGGGATSAPAPGSSAVPSTGQTGGGAHASTGPRASASPTAINGVPQASAQDLPITATVTPACVTAGGLATLTVQTVPEGAIAFLAVYHGEQSGAEPPWGKGYGGNSKGMADPRGSWTSTWTVAANAPTGSARVIVVVGSKGKQRQVDVPFSVGGRETNGCGT
jgi:hypothetical protein